MTDADERLRELLERLEPRTSEEPEWEDVLARLDAQPVRARARWSWRRYGLWRPTLLVAAVAVASAVALGVTTPWRGGPTILQRASAAIRTPTPAQVLHMYYNEKTGGCCRVLSGLDTELWAQGSAPRHFRVVFPGVEAPFDEGGGSFDRRSGWSGFRYDSRTNTLEPLHTGSHVAKGEFDPVAIVRGALAAGTAHAAGSAVVSGKKAVRIELTALDRQGTRGTAVYYVDPKTYRPIGIDCPQLVELRLPFEPVFGNGIYNVRVRFSVFEYLPATPENLELANIRAMHPTARRR